MSTKTFLLILISVALLLAGVVYMHMPRAAKRATALHGGQ